MYSSLFHWKSGEYTDKNLINIIKKYDKRDSIKKISFLIRKVEKLEPTSWKGYRPWDLLLILKLIILYADFKPNKRINENNIHELLDKILKITNIPYEDPDPDKTLRKTMRVLAYQQFFWYERVFIDNISRQIIMIKSISDTRIDELFQKETGLKITIFTQVLFILWVWVNQFNELWIDLNDVIVAEVKKEDLDKVIRYISRDEVELKGIILGDERIKEFRLQIFDRSSIIRFPIIRLEKKYLLYSKTVLENYFNLFIYNFVKGNLKDDQQSNRIFAESFERYVEKLLLYLGLNYKNESSLKEIVGQKSKVVDFLLQQEDLNLLIEVKSAQLTNISQVDPQDMNLIIATKSNIIEAFIKSVEFIKNFKINTNSLNGDFKLFILTYKQMNFSSFSEIWDEFIKDYVNKENLLNQNDILDLLPSNVYIISIVEFESLVSILNSKNVSIIDILSYINEQENSIETKKYSFNDYLEHYKDNYSEISFLKDEFDNSILSEIKDRLLRKDLKKR